jgi:hypothetical protein
MRKLSLGAGRTGAVWAVLLLQIACSAAFAQTTETPVAAPAAVPDAAEEAARTSAPFGGCEPIGLTASGELVFPLECKRAITKATPVASDEKAPPTEDKPVTAEVKPAVVEEKHAAAAETAVADIKVEAKPAADVGSAVAGDKPAAVTMPVVAEAKPAVSDTTATVETTPVAVEAKIAVPAPDIAAPADKTKKTAHGGAKGAGKPSVQAAAPAPRQVAMARPEHPAPSKRVEDKAAPVRTAGASGCMHYRSYNPASKSYRGFDGRMYDCR